MHIVFVCATWPPEQFATGIVTYTNHLRNELINRGHQVTLLIKPLYADELNQADLIAVRPTLLFRLQARCMRVLGQPRWFSEQWGRIVATTLLALHRKRPVDVIEMEESFGWCGAVAERTNIPLVVKLHGPTFLVDPLGLDFEPIKTQKITNEGQALTKVSTIISPAQCTLDNTLAYYTLSPQYAQQVVNPVVGHPDLPLWDATTSQKNLLLFVGRFDAVKGADTVLQAFKILLDKNHDLKLLFVGPDNGLVDKEGRHWSAQHYIDHVFDFDQRTNVKYLGQRTPSEIEVLRIQARATIVASRWENQPYTVLEAMLQGCPIVASASGGIAEIIEDGVTGRLFKSAQPQALANALAALLSAPEYVTAQMGHRARCYVLEKHSPAAVADATLQAYEHAIAQTASRARRNRLFVKGI